MNRPVRFAAAGHKLYFFLILLFFSGGGRLTAQTAVGDSSAGRFLRYNPETFSNRFTLSIPVVFQIRSGDTVSTETLDAGGKDKNGVERHPGGNPLTGPFYIEHARPGDVLAVTLVRLTLNRSTAVTTVAFVKRSVPATVSQSLPQGPLAKWHLDSRSGFAFPDSAYQHLGHLRIPLHPFVGCIGVAPLAKENEVLSFFEGDYGGNLDNSSIAQGATIYLPVFHDGAFLFLGDGHAAQGDGEVAGNALETSMDIVFTVRLIPGDSLKLTSPRVEDSLFIGAIGVDKTLDKALQKATSGLIEWLRADYKLSLSEASLVVSTSVIYHVAEIADPAVEVEAKIKKEILLTISK